MSDVQRRAARARDDESADARRQPMNAVLMLIVLAGWLKGRWR